MELLERLLETQGFESLKYFDQKTLPSSQSYKLLLPLLPPAPLEQSHGVEGAVDRKKENSDKNERGVTLLKVREKQEMFKPLERHIAQELAVQQVLHFIVQNQDIHMFTSVQISNIT